MIKVLCALLEQHERVLVAQRSENMQESLMWEFPGGKLESGETEQECLIREIQEEFNLAIEPYQRLSPTVYHYRDRSIELIPYICHYLGGTIQLLEHRAYQWALCHELPQYNWCPADLPIVEEYLKLKRSVS